GLFYMVERKLWIRRFVSVILFGGMALLQGCPVRAQNLGITLVYKCEGPSIIDWEFVPDGMRPTSPGVVSCGPRGGAHMSFMPSDIRGEMPKIAEVEWWVHPLKENRFRRRLDLSTVLTNEVIRQVSENRDTTQLRLVLTFERDQLTIEAQANKWR